MSIKVISLKKFISQTWIVVLLLLAIGAGFRLYHAGSYSVGFDQVQILEKANQILQGDYTLVGPRTGPAQMFTGPLIYYVAAIFIKIFSDVVTVYGVPTFFAVITGITIFLLLKKYQDTRAAEIGLLIWAVSPYLISLDRFFWNPNLILLAASLVFFPLLKKKIDWLGCFFIGLGAFLAYQAHFSGLVLVLFALVTTVVWNKSLRAPVALLLGLVASLTPTFLFDLRHQWLNLRGLLGLLNDKSDVKLPEVVNDLISNFFIITETWGKITFFGNHTQTIVVFGGMLILATLLLLHRDQLVKLSLTWLAATAVFFTFYHGPKPEYYFLFCLPALFVLMIKLLTLLSPHQARIVLGALVVNAFFVNQNLLSKNTGMTLQNLLQIKYQHLSQPVKEIVYDIEYGSDLGARYFFDQVKLDPQGKIVHVNYPTNLKFNNIQRIADIAVWSDPRVGQKNYLSTKTYFLESNPDYFLLRNDYPRKMAQDFDLYAILTNNTKVAELAVAHENNNRLDWVDFCLKENQQGHGPGWIQFSTNEFVKLFPSYCVKISLGDLLESEMDGVGIRIF